MMMNNFLCIKFTKLLIIVVLLICLSHSLYSQNNISVGNKRSNLYFGLTLGYKSDAGSSSLIVGYLFKRVVDLSVHLGANKYEGGAIGGGLKLFLLPKPKFKPYVGITYDHITSAGSGFSVGSDSLESVYSVNNNTIVLYQIGILYEEPPGSIFMSLNYKTTYPGNHLTLDRGPQNKGVENTASRVYAPGLGITIGIIFHWWGKKDSAVTKKQATF